MNIKSIPILEDIKEKDFPEFILSKGYNCIRFSIRNKRKIKEITHYNLTLDYDSLGHPDFFIWKGKQYWFCEFKSKGDKLSNCQLCWLASHKEFPKAIAFVMSNPNKYFESLPKKKTEEEKAKERKNRIRWNKWDKIVNDYCKKYPPSTMMRHEYRKGKYCWLGTIPYKLVEKLKEGGVY